MIKQYQFDTNVIIDLLKKRFRHKEEMTLLSWVAKKQVAMSTVGRAELFSKVIPDDQKAILEDFYYWLKKFHSQMLWLIWPVGYAHSTK